MNRNEAEALIAAGRMRPAGLAEIERANAEGRWDAAYDGLTQGPHPTTSRTRASPTPSRR